MTASRQARKAPSTHTVRTLVDEAHIRLKCGHVVYGHGTTNAWDEAVYLVLHALRLPLEHLKPVLHRAVTPAERRRALRLVEARIDRRVPSAYLTREAWLGDLRFYVDERVLIPRSFISELLRNRLAPWITRARSVRRVLDLCTGSGCLAIQLALTFPSAHVDATDISRPALAVARRNVGAYGLRERITLVESDMFAALHGRTYDLIVANPPYVSTHAMRTLPREYRHEPRLALAGGRDGFDPVRAILLHAAEHLTADGLLLVEIGHHRKELEALFPGLPFLWPETSGGDDCVFMLERRELPAHAPLSRGKLPSRRPARRATAASHRH